MDASLELDPFVGFGSILALSIVVSIISGVYYFKLYELMSPSASNAEMLRYVESRSVYMMQDRATIGTTVVLVILLAS